MRSRAWCFTINNYSTEEFEGLKKVPAQYIVIGREVGDHGTPHLQGYVYFTDAKSRSSVSKMFPRSHLEKRFGTSTQAAEYCKKDGDYWEHGEEPVEPSEARERGGKSTKILWDKILEHVRRGDTEYVAVNYPKIYIQLKPRLESLHAPTVAPMSGELLHEWWVGESGTGKSKALWELYPAHFEKPLNKWWDGYKHEEIVAIEEWSPQNICTSSSLKRWADRYPFAGEIKGGVMQRLRPRKIIVLSNYRPDQCFTMVEDLNPILRRFTILEFPKDIQRARFRAAWFNEQPEEKTQESDSDLSVDSVLPDIDIDTWFN